MTNKSASTTWIPLFGTFLPDADSITYVGKRVPVAPTPETPNPDPPDQPAVGLALSNHTLGDGEVWADVEFQDITSDSMCRSCLRRQCFAARSGRHRRRHLGVVQHP